MAYLYIRYEKNQAELKSNWHESKMKKRRQLDSYF
jgi:hypothetical protein